MTLGYAISRNPGGEVSSRAARVRDARCRQRRAPLSCSASSFINRLRPAFSSGGRSQGNGRATYGIESYYVQEGTGHDYEAAVRNRRLWAEVALASDGAASLRGLVIE